MRLIRFSQLISASLRENLRLNLFLLFCTNFRRLKSQDYLNTRKLKKITFSLIARKTTSAIVLSGGGKLEAPLNYGFFVALYSHKCNTPKKGRLTFFLPPSLTETPS